MRYFVTAIGTDSGKTVVSAILCQALNAAYWKPIQCGFPRDLDSVKSLTDNENVRFYEEQYLFKTAASPHAAAKIENANLNIKDFECPDHDGDLVIEGAGGLLVPINNQENIIDLIRHFESEVILVANLYLGSINHSLMSVEALKNRGIKVKGIIFNGHPNKESESIILLRSGYRNLLHLSPENKVDKRIIAGYAAKLKMQWNE